MTSSRIVLFNLFASLMLFGFHASAAKYPNPVTGSDAQMLYEVATDPSDPEAVGPHDLAAGCHYTKQNNQFEMSFCDSANGFINSPVREILSAILLKHRVPEFVEEDRYSIGVHFTCTKDPKYSCELEDLEDYNDRISK